VNAELVVPESRDVARDMPSQTLYALEIAGQIATELLDERVVAWTEEGKTQTWIASELGCVQSVVSDRQRRLGVEPRSNRGRPRKEISATDNSNGEVVDAEVVEPDEVIHPEPPVGHLPDFVAPDADTNLRTVSLRWFQWGRDVLALLEEGAELEAKSREDKRAVKEQADLMVRIARALKGAL
jgi:hypothetical protein